MEAVNLIDMVSKDFAKLGRGSLEGISNMCMRPRNSDYLSTDYALDDELNIEMNAEIKNIPIRLWQINDETPIFGIDTSSILLGNTKKGLLCAVRGSVVLRKKAVFQYVRHGPFIFHITERNRYALYNTLRQIYLDADDPIGAPILEGTVERIRSILERWLQKQLCESTHDSIILWDGSLTTRTINGPTSVIGEILHTARNNRNYILALSKKTTLTMMGRRLSDLIDGRLAPCLLDIDDAIRLQFGNHLQFLGKIYAAKLSPTSFTFRLDIDRRASEAEGFNATCRLLGNELLADGYPETLRLAHILSRFSATDVLAMQRYVAANYGLKIEPVLDIRQALFGPYGGSGQMRLNGYDASL